VGYFGLACVLGGRGVGLGSWGWVGLGWVGLGRGLLG